MSETTYKSADETRAFLDRQRQQAKAAWASLDCECERVIPIRFMYRCLYCGIWLCQECAEVHFGKTREQYLREKAVTPTTPQPDEKGER